MYIISSLGSASYSCMTPLTIRSPTITVHRDSARFGARTHTNWHMFGQVSDRSRGHCVAPRRYQPLPAAPPTPSIAAVCAAAPIMRCHAPPSSSHRLKEGCPPGGDIPGVPKEGPPISVSLPGRRWRWRRVATLARPPSWVPSLAPRKRTKRDPVTELP